MANKWTIAVNFVLQHNPPGSYVTIITQNRHISEHSSVCQSQASSNPVTYVHMSGM